MRQLETPVKVPHSLLHDTEVQAQMKWIKMHKIKLSELIKYSCFCLFVSAPLSTSMCVWHGCLLCQLCFDVKEAVNS